MYDFDVLKISEGNDDGAREGDELEHETTGLSPVRLDVRAADIPRAPALLLSPEAAVSTAIESMRRHRRGAAIVVQAHRPVGVVSDRDILTRASADLDDLRAIPIRAVMSPCLDPLRDTDTVGTALRRMCAHRQWHLPMVCRRGLFLGALDIADISLWLRDGLTMITVDAAFADAGA